ncbi:MAG: outer-membrane lipoprotein carrier protein LolA [Clostridiales bacterium]|jgi:outer membrane lipoprotein-sorting protein|nr:outer-membrane lipoprotein carrier protein LolA [Clostridiales bacterium]
MKKKLMLLMLICVGALAMSACAAVQERVDATAYERIHRQLMSMESFAAQATVTFISNNNTHTYETIQHARISGEYRIEVTAPQNVAGNTTVFDGTTITQYNPRVDGRISQTTTEAPERLELLLTSFVRNFVTSQEVSVTAATLDSGLTTVLEAAIPGDHPYIATQSLWVNNDTGLPAQMKVFDQNGTERIIVIFNSFEYNVNIGDDMFQVRR